jgi:hypothetical protein
VIFESFWSLKILVGQSFMRIYFRYGFDLAFTAYVFRVHKINAAMVNVSQNASRLKSPAVAKIDEYAE